MKQHLIIGLFVITAILITRLLFINSNVFFFDGDEAIVGLMGLDYLNGNFPLYFYGQKYGLAFFEAILVSFGILLFTTTSMLSIKIPMMVLWAASVVLIAISFQSILKKKGIISILFISVLILAPTWLVWSLKARGGYLTSLFFSSLVIFLLTQKNWKLKIWQWGLVGVCLVIIYEAQPLWLPGILPVIGYGLYMESSRLRITRSTITVLLSGFISFSGLYLYKSNLFVAWSTPKPSVFDRIAKINQLPETLISNLGGNYFLSSTYEPLNKPFSLIFILTFVLFGAVCIKKLISFP